MWFSDQNLQFMNCIGIQLWRVYPLSVDFVSETLKLKKIEKSWLTIDPYTIIQILYYLYPCIFIGSK
jgi:hypothetical protein